MKLKNRKRIFSDSIFANTLVMLLVMSLATMLVMWLFVSQIVTRNQRTQIHELNRSQLMRVSEDMDTRLAGIEDVMGQMLFSKNGVSLMINAGTKDSDLGYRMMADLNSLVAENALIQSAALYLPTTSNVFGSDGKIASLEEHDLCEVIEDYLEIRETGRPVDSEVTGKYMVRNGELYLISDFCAPYFIGAMIVHIDMTKVGSILRGSDGDEFGTFLLLDEERNILVGTDALSEAVRTSLNEDKVEFLGVSEARSDRGIHLLCKTSDKTGLIYGLYVDDTKGNVKFSSLLLTLLPFLIVYGIGSFLYSLYISRRIYRPIRRLMQITLGQKQELDEVRKEYNHNEMAYLEQAFQDTWGENEQNKILLANISQDVMEQLFRGLISGKNMEESYIVDTLRGLGMESMIHGRFVVMAGWLAAAEVRERSSIESGMYRRSILNFLNEYPTDSCMQLGLFVDENVLAIIIAFSEDTSALAIKKTLEGFCGELKKYTEQLPFSLILGCSKTCQEITAIRSAYHDAYTQMEYLRYVAEDADEEEIAGNGSLSNDNKYYAEYAQRLAETAEKDSRDETETMISTLVAEISTIHMDQWKRSVESIMDCLVEKMISVRVPAEEMKSISATMDLAMGTENVKLRDDRLYATLTSAVKAIFANSRKSRYRYVDVAKDYISAHYSDGNLSLNEVSEAVGISAPYLSGIFAESEEIGFAAYLARYRVEQAKQFLSQTTQNVTEIGYKCGFNSAQSFSRVFKKHTGHTPGQYREYCRERSRQEGKS